METLALVVPCYNEEKTIPIFYETVEKIKEQIPAKITYYFVDDGSKDRTLAILRTLTYNNPPGGDVHYISFSRNFGKEAALYAGLQAADGDYIATMDVDLQHPPALLPTMWNFLHEHREYDCVATRRISRTGEPKIRSFFAKLFYQLINDLSDTEIVDGAQDYRLMSRKMADAIVTDSEYNRFSKGIFSWVGFRTKWIPIENVERCAGTSKWSFWKLFRYSIEGILAYTTIPIYISSIIGLIMCGISFLALLFIVIRAMLFGDPVAGWPSLVSIITFLGGLILLCMGVMGLYIAKIYLETKHRQIYIVREER
jgi:glucosyltransferase